MAEVRRAVAAGVLASLATVAACAVTVATAAPSTAAVTCSYFDFRSSGFHSLSHLVRVSLPAGTASDLGQLDYRIQAAGYSAPQDLVYGIATHDKHGWLLRRPLLVTVSRAGKVTSLGEIRYGVGGIGDATAAAVVGSRLYVRDLHRIYTVDIDPRSTSYRKVLRSVSLSSVALGLSVDDFGADPRTGVLYGIATFGHVAKLVSLSPTNGAIRVIASVPGIPWQDSYSSVVVSSSAVYALHTGHGRTSRLYRIGFDGSSAALPSSPALADSDAAGCLTVAAPPPPPPPPPRTTTPRTPPRKPHPTPRPTPHPPKPKPKPGPTSTPPHRSSPTPTVMVPPRPQPTPTAPRASAPPVVAPPPTPRSTPPPNRPTPTPTPKAPVRSSPPVHSTLIRPAAAEPATGNRSVQVLRRWSLATLLIILSGGAAMGAQRRMRRR